MFTTELRVSFGEQIAAVVSVEYHIDQATEEIIVESPQCSGLILGDLYDRKHVAFVSSGHEAEFADAIAGLALQTWSGRIKDACRNDLERRKKLSLNRGVLQ